MMWDKEADVVIVGYGLSGAVAAIEAHDSGSRVLIIEKGQYPGGCSILSGGYILCADRADDASAYLSALSDERVEPDLIRTFAEGLTENEAYLRHLSEINGGKVIAFGRRGKKASSLIGEYPYEGADAFYTAVVQEIPGFRGFPWVQKLTATGVNLMKTSMDHVEKREIPVFLSTSAKRLVVDSGGSIIGVEAKSGGSKLAVRARRAVVLACGGFEHNTWMLMQYLQGKPFFSMAPLTHTGDGIIMAQKAGAALWHMWHVHGSYGFKFPEFPIAFRHVFGGGREPKRIMPWIVVDKFGSRYMNEYPPAPQDTGHRAMELFDADIPGYPRIPSFLIFDDDGRKRGPIGQPLSIGEYAYEWSDDNLKEVQRGWILQAETIGELALKIRSQWTGENGMDPQGLEGSILRWNQSVKERMDWLHRPPGTMSPIQAPPFFAVPVWPTITNTQGGPVHNERQQVIDAFGEPIPHLYSAGELGSFFSHLYQLSGNLGECLTSGRMAGRHAASEAPS